MAIVQPSHYSIRTTDLDRSQRFYTEVLQLRVGFRPPFNFPGVWLYPDQDESEFGVVHLIEQRDEDPQGSGSVDHIAFLATDWPGMRQRCDALGVPYRVQRVPSLNLIQVFLVDPSGVTIELNYRSNNTELSKGIGKVFAEVLASRGMNVVLVARSKELLSAYAQSLSEKYAIRAVAIGADLASPRAPLDIQTELASQNIEIDLLINNAGFGLSGSFLSHDLKQEEEQIQVNVQALTALTHIFGKSMAARGRGGIINLASNSSFQPLPYMAGYAATKAFVLYFKIGRASC